jgi:tetratricopeptide (TPR) repeat protein
MRRGVIVSAVLAAFVLPLGAQAQESRTIVLSDLQAAQVLIANGRLDDAKKVLERRLAATPEDSETLFLLATIATAEKDYDSAISLYRHILANEPNAERVRLELARAFFLKGDYDNADRQFRFARAGDVPDAVKANIDQFLSAINRQRQWTFNFSAALAPDTNQNAATSLTQVNIYGLPFALNANARRHSGIGVTGDVATI